MICIALATRQQNGLSWYNIGTIRRTRIGNVRRKIDRVQRCSILEGEVSTELPVLQNRPQNRCIWKGVNVAGAQPAPYIEEGEPALKPQIPFVLRAEAFKQPRNLGVRIIDGFRPHKTGQERQPTR